MKLPSCTVVVATYNRAQGLKRLLESMASQDIGPDNFEVIVVDDGSTDDTWQLLASIETPYQLRRLTQRNQGPAAARNAAILAAKGEIIVTLDDDVEPRPDLLRRHLEAHLDEQAVAAIGRFALPLDARLAPWVEWEFSGLEQQYAAMLRGDWEPTPRQFYTANSSVPRWAYISAGLFDPVFRRAEDVELAYRLQDLGLRFEFLPDAVIDHRPHRTFEGWQSIARQYGYYDVLMWRDKGREHILPLIGHEFRNNRPRSLQVLAKALVGRRRVFDSSLMLIGLTTRLASYARLQRFAKAGFGAIFNLLYWQAVADALGSREAFLQILAASETGVARSRRERQNAS